MRGASSASPVEASCSPPIRRCERWPAGRLQRRRSPRLRGQRPGRCGEHLDDVEVVQVGDRVHVDRLVGAFFVDRGHLADQEAGRVERVVGRRDGAGGDDVFAAGWPARWRAGTAAAGRWVRPPSAARCPSRCSCRGVAETPIVLSVMRSTCAPSEATCATLPTRPSPLMTGSLTCMPDDEPASMSTVEYQMLGDLPITVGGHRAVVVDAELIEVERARAARGRRVFRPGW